MQWVTPIDNLEAFNKYPWGIYYERTLLGLQRVLKNQVSKYQDKKKKPKGEVVVEASSVV